jgi:8-oxo-dGTP pyrophosphatase MutT (NUDIX family)
MTRMHWSAMSTERSKRPENAEFSAGGVVVRGQEVMVIVPTRRGAGGGRVLALPKGHPEPGENAEQAAAREVREEAGVWGDLVESLGEVAYTYERKGHRIAKRVEFFLIQYRGGDPADHDHEVDDARWMPLSEAALALTYEGERRVLARAISRRPPGL